MKRVTIKQTSFKGIAQNPSLLGFGCMRFPETPEGDIDQSRSQALIDDAFKKGVTHFDTAYPYHGGQSESFIGKALKKYPRDAYTLATKCPTWEIDSVADVKRIFEEQLENLGVDYVDYYLCHALNKENVEAYKLPGVLAYLERLKHEGKIKHLGFSFHDTPDVLAEILQLHDWDFVLLQINFLDWTFQNAKKQYALVKEKGLPVMVMEPVRGGALAQLNDEAVKLLKQAAPEQSIASWALRYAASLDQVMLVLSGMSHETHVQDNINTFTDFKPLTNREKKVLNKALQAYLKSNTVPCTSCDYCMPCPYGVKIPDVFNRYNEYAISKFKGRFIKDIESLNDHGPSTCTECGECLEKCPQKIDIPQKLSQIHKVFEQLK